MNSKVISLENLMIGDWIYNTITQKPYQVYPQWFSQCDNCEKNNKGWFYRTFKSISLTNEILELNGFKLTKDIQFQTYSEEEVYYFEDKEKQLRIEIEYQEDDYGNVFYVVKFVCGCSSLEYYISELYELQHIFKFCNYKKNWIINK